MRKKQNSTEQVIIVADGEFSAPNLIRSDNDWVGIPVQWIHLVPNREQLERVQIVLRLHYRDTGDNDGTETE